MRLPGTRQVAGGAGEGRPRPGDGLAVLREVRLVSREPRPKLSEASLVVGAVLPVFCPSMDTVLCLAQEPFAVPWRERVAGWDAWRHVVTVRNAVARSNR